MKKGAKAVKHTVWYQRLTAFLLTAAIFVSCGTAFALPSPTASGSDRTAQSCYREAEKLSQYIRSRHIHSGINDNPLLEAWQMISGDTQKLSRYALRKTLLQWFAKNPSAYLSFLDLMLDMYDSFSNFYPVEQNQDASAEDDYYDVGFTVHPYGRLLRVDSVMPYSSASFAGLEVGDMIIGINNADLRFLKPEQRELLLSGLDNDSMTIRVCRAGREEILTFLIEPELDETPLLNSVVLENGVGLLTIHRFSGDSFAEDLQTTLVRFSEEDVRTVVIDLRDNPGGTIEALLTALNAFVPQTGRLLFSDVSRSAVTSYYSQGGGYKTDALYILVNEESASSAEIFAGSLRDLGIATLVGTTTYGKGCGQAVIPFNAEMILTLTVSEVELPITGNYNTIGLMPDIQAVSECHTLETDKLQPLSLEHTINRKSEKTDILALEQRLALCGFLHEEPDGIYDETTTAALAELYEGLGSRSVDGAYYSALKALTQMTADYDGAYYEVDTVLNTVLETIDRS